MAEAGEPRENLIKLFVNLTPRISKKMKSAYLLAALLATGVVACGKTEAPKPAEAPKVEAPKPPEAPVAAPAAPAADAAKPADAPAAAPAADAKPAEAPKADAKPAEAPKK